MMRRLWLILIPLFSLAAQTPELLKLDGDISPVHDPVIIKQNDIWYVFAPAGLSGVKDLHHWATIGKVFEKLPDWATAEIPGTRGGYWAPDVSVYKGSYRLYYAVSPSAKTTPQLV